MTDNLTDPADDFTKRITSVLSGGVDVTGIHFSIEISDVDDEQRAIFKFLIGGEQCLIPFVVQTTFNRHLSDSMRTCFLQTVPNLINQKLHNVNFLYLENTSVLPGLARAIIRALVTPSSQSVNDENRDNGNNGNDPMDADNERQEQQQDQNSTGGHESNDKVAIIYFGADNCGTEFLVIPDGQEDFNQFTNLKKLALAGCVLNESEQSELGRHLTKYAKASLQECVFNDVTFTIQQEEETAIPPILRALPHHENLERLIITNSLQGFNVHSLLFFAHLIEHAFPNLKTLNLHHHERLFPANHDFEKQSFFKGITAREALALEIRHFFMDGACWIDLGMSLQTTSKVNHLQITGSHLLTGKGVESMAKGIRDNNYLHTLCIDDCRLSPEAMSTLSSALATSKSLVSLSIGTTNDASTLELMTHLVAAGNSNKIEHLSLVLTEIGDETSARLGDFLANTKNKSLHIFPASASILFGLAFGTAIRRGLRSSTTLESFMFMGKTQGEDVDEIISQGMEQNYSVVTVFLPNREIGRFYAHLNRLGRRKILDPKFPTGLLAKMYAKLKNISNLYYFLRQRPPIVN